jgi:hypothetical protein
MSKKTLKLTKKELEEITTLNKVFLETKVKLADVVYSQKTLLDTLDSIKSKFVVVEQKLIEKYGDNSTINLNDGTVTPSTEPEK